MKSPSPNSGGRARPSPSDLRAVGEASAALLLRRCSGGGRRKSSSSAPAAARPWAKSAMGYSKNYLAFPTKNFVVNSIRSTRLASMRTKVAVVATSGNLRMNRRSASQSWTSNSKWPYSGCCSVAAAGVRSWWKSGASSRPTVGRVWSRHRGCRIR